MSVLLTLGVLLTELKKLKAFPSSALGVHFFFNFLKALIYPSVIWDSFADHPFVKNVFSYFLVNMLSAFIEDICKQP